MIHQIRCTDFIALTVVSLYRVSEKICIGKDVLVFARVETRGKLYRMYLLYRIPKRESDTSYLLYRFHIWTAIQQILAV